MLETTVLKGEEETAREAVPRATVAGRVVVATAVVRMVGKRADVVSVVARAVAGRMAAFVASEVAAVVKARVGWEMVEEGVLEAAVAAARVRVRMVWAEDAREAVKVGWGVAMVVKVTAVGWAVARVATKAVLVATGA